MDQSDCPYLVRETITYRVSLDLSRPAPTRVTVTWHCSHPFHGVRLALGDSRATVEERCAECALPRLAPAEEGRASTPQRRGTRAGYPRRPGRA